MKPCLLSATLLAVSMSCSNAVAEKRFIITEQGAVADSKTINTAAIQKTIDAAAAGGGTVVIPKGTFVSGALFLKPGVNLLLEKNAVLHFKLHPDTPQHYEDLKGETPPQSTIRNISLTNIKGKSGTFGIIKGNPNQTTISDITLKDIDLKVQKESSLAKGTSA